MLPYLLYQNITKWCSDVYERHFSFWDGANKLPQKKKFFVFLNIKPPLATKGVVVSSRWAPGGFSNSNRPAPQQLATPERPSKMAPDQPQMAVLMHYTCISCTPTLQNGTRPTPNGHSDALYMHFLHANPPKCGPTNPKWPF